MQQLPDDTLTPEWLAAWAVHLGGFNDFAYLFAGILDTHTPAAEAVLEILKDSAANRHEIGGPGDHATRGLLCSSRSEAWEFMENLLLAAQRQEGLRQSILEAVDEAHPQAFVRMVALVLNKNLIRFASVARATGVWLGEEESVESPKKLKADLLAICTTLTAPTLRQQWIAKGDGPKVYRGLWGIAFEDAEAAVKAAAPLFKDKTPRVVSRRRSSRPRRACRRRKLMLPLLDDADPRLVSLAASLSRTWRRTRRRQSQWQLRRRTSLNSWKRSSRSCRRRRRN